MSLALGLHWDFITQLWRIKHWGRKGLGPDWRPGTRLEAWDQTGGLGPGWRGLGLDWKPGTRLEVKVSTPSKVWLL